MTLMGQWGGWDDVSYLIWVGIGLCPHPSSVLFVSLFRLSTSALGARLRRVVEWAACEASGWWGRIRVGDHLGAVSVPIGSRVDILQLICASEVCPCQAGHLFAILPSANTPTPFDNILRTTTHAKPRADLHYFVTCSSSSLRYLTAQWWVHVRRRWDMKGRTVPTWECAFQTAKSSILRPRETPAVVFQTKRVV